MNNKDTKQNQLNTGKSRSAQIIIYLLLHCVLMAIAWQNDLTVFLIFFAFVPLFILLRQPSYNYNERLQLHIFSFIAVFVAIYLITYWIRNVNAGSHFATVMVGAITVYLPYLGAYFIRYRLKRSVIVSALAFCFIWLIAEVLHALNILGLPYGNLGHLLGALPGLVQWYAITGSLGGTAWILLVNLSIFYIIKNLVKKSKPDKIRLVHVFLLILSILLPPFTSLIIQKRQKQNLETGIQVIAVHTSMDVFEFKYNVQPSDLVDMYIGQSRPQVDTSLKTIIFWPENAITGDIYFSSPDSSLAVNMIREDLISQTSAVLVTGAIIDKIVDPPAKEEYTPGILYDSLAGMHYRHYNTALLLKQDESASIKIKKRLVPFSEEIPPHRIFSPIVKLVPNLADLSFSRGNNYTTVFSFFGDQARTSPIICYGSTFSPFVAQEMLASRSNFMAIILNEGWMKSKKAYTHFNWFAVCRAIENRRFTVKSSNEGISAIINCNGRVLERVEGPHPGVIKATLRANNSFTFFTKNHKAILNAILILSIAGMVWVLAGRHRPKP